MRSTSVPRSTPPTSQKVGGVSFEPIGDIAQAVGCQLLCRRQRAAGSLRLASHVLRAFANGNPVDDHVVIAAIDAISELQVSLQ